VKEEQKDKLIRDDSAPKLLRISPPPLLVLFLSSALQNFPKACHLLHEAKDKFIICLQVRSSRAVNRRNCTSDEWTEFRCGIENEHAWGLNASALT